MRHDGALEWFRGTHINSCDSLWLSGTFEFVGGGPGYFDGVVYSDGTIVNVPFYACTDFDLPMPSTLIASLIAQVIRPIDPNEKVGPVGMGNPATERFIAPEEELTYVVYFENVRTATAPAQEVVVTDYLDSDLDWSTFRLSEIVWADHSVAIPPDTSVFFSRETIPDYRVGVDKAWWVDVNADLHYATGRVKWTLRTLDPDTGDWPEDALAGFLPPNDDTGRGEGHVVFTIKAKRGLADGTRIANSASIVFDTEQRIDTNEVFNTIGRPAAEPRDIDRDGRINAMDVQLVINRALGLDIGGVNADVNGDGLVNAMDVQLVINGALGL